MHYQCTISVSTTLNNIYWCWKTIVVLTQLNLTAPHRNSPSSCWHMLFEYVWFALHLGYQRHLRVRQTNRLRFFRCSTEGTPKIWQLHRGFVQRHQQVVWLDVSVDNPRRTGIRNVQSRALQNWIRNRTLTTARKAGDVQWLVCHDYCTSFEKKKCLMPDHFYIGRSMKINKQYGKSHI